VPNAEYFFIRLAWHCDDNDRINTSGDTTPRRVPNAEYFFIRLAWHCDDNDRINTSGDTKPRRTLRAGAAAYAMLARLSTRTT
jgi:hypothetical protein